MSKVGHPDLFMGIAIIFGAVGSGLFTTFTVDTPTGEWIGYQIIFAISSSLCSVTPLMVAQQALPLKDIPIGSGLVMFSQTVGAYVHSLPFLPSSLCSRCFLFFIFYFLFLFGTGTHKSYVCLV